MAYGYSQVKCLVGFIRKGNLKGALDFFKIMQPIHYSTIGASDIIGVLQFGGKFIAIECKGPKGDQSDMQKYWKLMMEDQNGIHIVAWQVSDVYNAIRSFVPREFFPC